MLMKLVSLATFEAEDSKVDAHNLRLASIVNLDHESSLNYCFPTKEGHDARVWMSGRQIYFDLVQTAGDFKESL